MSDDKAWAEQRAFWAEQDEHFRAQWRRRIAREKRLRPWWPLIWGAYGLAIIVTGTAWGAVLIRIIDNWRGCR